jgi:chromosome segregation protein
MTALLTRLRIAGFKSFAEPVALDILPGLTGIVGPNGCGKSNVVEALRWAMGESSARSLRGGEMDDVIFAGTAARSSRNLAEVSITLQRGGEAALPDPFGADDEVTVTRRIERGAGSAYRANGREMRARDVQTLFADLASGAKSSAMVSQGRVSALVNARPEERRAVLEEAAGITGLHARRHEAELKLRAADANLTKAEELRAQLETGREGLRKQARQASRYRNISGLVRAAESDFLAVLHARAAIAERAASEAQANAVANAAAAELAVVQAAAALEAAEAAVPGPRAAEAEARSLLERRRVEAESLSQEAARAGKALADALARLAVIEADLADAAAGREDADGAVQRLTAEAGQLRTRLAALPGEIEMAQVRATAESEATRRAESEADAAGARAAEAAAASRQAALAVAQAAARAAESDAALGRARAACEAAQAALIDPAVVAAAATAAAEAGVLLAAARDAVAAAEAGRDENVAAAGEARAVLARETGRAAQAGQRRREAEVRLARLESALAQIGRDLAAAHAALVPADVLDAAGEAERLARAALAQAERQAGDAEHGHTEAGAARLAALTQRDQAGAARARLDTARDDAAGRKSRLDGDVAGLARALAVVEAAQIPAAALAGSRGAAAAAEAASAEAAAGLARCAEGRALADGALAEARAQASARAAELARLTAEADGLRQALGAEDPDSAPLLDAVDVPAGLEAACGAVFADAPAMLERVGLAVSGDTGSGPAAARFWRALPPLAPEPAPAGCEVLGTLVRAPDALARALSHTALLPAGADGDTLQAALAPGWVLVSAEGGLWRWDGQVCRAGAPSAAASRLKSRARLRGLAGALEGAAAADEAARQAADEAEAAASAASGFEAEARKTLAAAELALAARCKALAALEAEAEGVAAKIASLRPALSRAEADLAQAQAALAETDAALGGLPDPAAAEQVLQVASAQAEEARLALDAARKAREAATGALAKAAAEWRRLEAEATRAQSQVAALQPQLDRLQGEHEEAARLHQACLEECGGLPDIAALEAASVAAKAAEQEAVAALGAALRGAAGAVQARQEAADRVVALDRARAEAEMAFAAAGTMRASAETAHERETAALAAAVASRDGLPDAAALAEAAAAARQALAESRARASACAETSAALSAAHADAVIRLPGLDAEHAAWEARLEDAARRCDALSARACAAREECAMLADEPVLLSARAADSGTILAQAEARHEDAARALREAEDRLRDAARAQRDADAAQSACREILARGEGGADAARAALRGVLERAAERLGPDAALPEVALADVADPSRLGEAEEERARKKLDRLQRERDEMGPVNLRADLELDEIDGRIAAIDADREELTTAIAKLRGGIGHLNREGRQRLTEVFTQVDTHFRTLFTRMMGGGRAHLALTGSDDPLEAGLEIYAEPPGKKLSALTLLSGGEQALTALSLIFAVFRCTPAPVAVLDEVDAPLDDVNVDRFCGLLEDVVRDTGTRFLVVTHHQLTMSRMDRLFGVTMQERGVSRLLSVDLRRAAEMVEPVMHAAE